jgi:oligoendopeptidase F
MPATLLPREQVSVEQTWNLADIYPTFAMWKADIGYIEAALPSLVAYRGRLGEGPATLLAYLQARDTLAARFEKVCDYAEFSLATDGSSSLNQAMQARSTALTAQIATALSWVADELLALPPGTVEGYLATEPGLAPYRQQLEAILLQRGHRLAPQAEQCLAALDEALNLSYTLWERTTAADVTCASIEDGQGGQVSVSLSRWGSGLAQSPDRILRRRAYASLTEGLARHQHALAVGLSAHVRRNVALARLRGYGSAVEMLLAPECVPMSVYHTILEVVPSEVAPHMQRLLRLRQRVLGVEQLHHYDLQAPLALQSNRRVSYDQAQRLIRAGLSVLGEEYGNILDTAFRERWIDRADNLGKQSGAFSDTVYSVHPYVFTTWHDDLRAAIVLAHELGHAAHALLAGRSQVISNTFGTGSAAFTLAQPTLFLVEAPSTANELLLGWHLLDTTQNLRLRRYIIEQFLGTFVWTLVTSPLIAQFQQRLYDLAEADAPITTDTLLELQGEMHMRFYGDAVALDEGARLSWALVSHFYDPGLYAYTYAVGMACAFSVAQAIRQEGAFAVQRWLDTLRLGTSLPPLELARHAGTDLSSPESLRRAVACFGAMVDELEATST